MPFPDKTHISQAALIARAPGRINIIGEHTDYNDGYVLPAAIDRAIKVQLYPNGDSRKVHVKANNLGESFSFELDQLQARTDGGWPNYVMGLISELQQLGADIRGFDAEFEGDIPIGGGVSSSAALECSFAVGLNQLFSLGLEPWQLIKAAQMAEHNFVGIKCGIMDQFASMMGKKDQVMLLDCRSLDFAYFPLDLKDYQLLLLNSNVSHALANTEYNLRRAECEEGVALLRQDYPEIKNLRDITPEKLLSGRPKLPERLFKRCHHVVSENQRVLDAVQAIKNGQYQALGQLMYQSHFSLQKDYAVSCPELDFLVNLTLQEDAILGSRMMGGGFGGCTLSLIKKDRATDFLDRAFKAYRQAFGTDLSPIEVSIGDGASITPA